MPKKKTQQEKAPMIPEREIPNPPVPNRAHTEMSEKPDKEEKEEPTLPEIPERRLF